MEENTETPTTENDAAAETVETIQPDSTAAKDSVENLYEEVLDPQLYATVYVKDDYVITLVHDITLGDFLVAMLLCVLIVVNIVSAVLGGGRRW